MAHADALSRNPVSVELKIARVDITEGNWVMAAQLQDEHWIGSYKRSYKEKHPYRWD